ncbi:hypothetical protein OH77DRAFT_587726 [Trametes cingulata]|nr:hypothetical protein OH77DRAFT_587726 [Trametes cingulata]
MQEAQMVLRRVRWDYISTAPGSWRSQLTRKLNSSTSTSATTRTSTNGRYGHSGGVAAICCLHMHTEAMGGADVTWTPGGIPARSCRGAAQLPRCTVSRLRAVPMSFTTHPFSFSVCASPPLSQCIFRASIASCTIRNGYRLYTARSHAELSLCFHTPRSGRPRKFRALLQHQVPVLLHRPGG